MGMHVSIDKEERGRAEEMRSVLSTQQQVVNACTYTQMDSHIEQIHKETHNVLGLLFQLDPC